MPTHKKDRSVKDDSVRVHHKHKLKNPITIRELTLTEKQKQFLELALNNDVQILIIKGVAGTSKTALSVYAALTLLNNKRVSDIVMVRSIVESADSKMGYLPGSSSDKMQPYMMPFLDKLDMFLSNQDIKHLQN